MLSVLIFFGQKAVPMGNRFFAFLKKSFASPNSRVSDTCGTFREM